MGQFVDDQERLHDALTAWEKSVKATDAALRKLRFLSEYNTAIAKEVAECKEAERLAARWYLKCHV